MNSKLGKLVIAAGVIWVLQPFPDLGSLHQFLGALPQASAESAKIIYQPPPQINCDTCDITTPGPWFLDYEVTTTTAGSLRRGGVPAN